MERGETRLVLLPEDIVAMETLVAASRDGSEINDTGEGLLEGLIAGAGIERRGEAAAGSKIYTISGHRARLSVENGAAPNGHGRHDDSEISG